MSNSVILYHCWNILCCTQCYTVSSMSLVGKRLIWGGLRLNTNWLDTSHSQRLNSEKLSLDTGRCDWWYPIEPCPNGTLLFVFLSWNTVTWYCCNFDTFFIVLVIKNAFIWERKNNNTYDARIQRQC